MSESPTAGQSAADFKVYLYIRYHYLIPAGAGESEGVFEPAVAGTARRLSHFTTESDVEPVNGVARRGLSNICPCPTAEGMPRGGVPHGAHACPSIREGSINGSDSGSVL